MRGTKIKIKKKTILVSLLQQLYQLCYNNGLDMEELLGCKEQ